MNRERSNLAAKVSSALEAEISRLGWPVGSVIATETALLERFEVSRPVLRQAVGILESKHVARMRRGPGGGLVVTAPDSTTIAEGVARYLDYTQTPPEQITEARETLEVRCVELAARRIDERGIETLRSHLRTELGRVEKGEMRAFADLHVMIAELSGNPVLHLFTGTLMTLVEARAHDRLPERADQAAYTRIHEEHGAIVESIVAGDAALARHRMSRHLENANHQSELYCRPYEPRSS